MIVAHPDWHPLDMLILNAVFDAGGSCDVRRLREQVPASGTEMRKAIVRQANIGNFRRHVQGEPLVLTASGKAAIAAGRAWRPMMQITMPARRCGKSDAALFSAIAKLAFAPIGGTQ